MRHSQPKLVQSRRLSALFLAAGCALVVGTATAWADTCSPTPSSGCGAPPCQNGWWWDGGSQQRGASPWPQYVSSSMNALNPYPVWSFSDAWDALENRAVCVDCIAQIGFEHAYGVSTYAKVFMQWSDNAGNLQPIHYADTILYDNTNYVFKVQRAFTSGGAPVGYDFGWLGASPYVTWYATPTNVTWGPDTSMVSGKLGDWSGQSTNTGSHAVGNRTTHIQIRGVNWQDQNGVPYNANLGNWLAANHGTGGLSSTPYQYLSVTNGANFDIWDNRCY